MTEPEHHGRHSSNVLSAILDRVDAPPERADQATVLFRSKALNHLDVAVEIDNQLPLVSRRTWLVVIGVIVLCISALVWAAFTPTQTSVGGTGRMVAPAGVVSIASLRDGTVYVPLPVTGTPVEPGQEVTRIRDMDGSYPVQAAIAGTMWQALVAAGDTVPAGAQLGTILPAGSDRTVLAPIAESAAAGLRTGMAVTVGGATRVRGKVTALSAPLPALQAVRTTGVEVPDGGTYVIVTVALESSVPPGTEVSLRIIQSEQSVLNSLIKRGA